MALTRICEHFLSAPSLDSGELPGADKYHVLLHVNTNEQHRDVEINGEPCCYLDKGNFLAPQVAKRLACEAAVTIVTEDDDGNVLNIGRKTRVIPKRIGMAVDIRDKHTCRFPGCYQSRYTDKHHIIHWANGGETSEENLLTLCRFHHSLIHKEEDYRIERRGNEVVFINKWGKEVVQALDPQFPDAPSPAEAMDRTRREHDDLGLEIDCQTAVTGWLGEICDYSLFLENMARRDGLPP